MKVAKLAEALKVAGLEVDSVSFRVDPSRWESDPRRVFVDLAADKVMILFKSAPSASDLQKLTQTLTGFDASPDDEEKLERFDASKRAVAALLIKQSSAWAALPNPRKARLQKLIDDEALEASQRLFGS